MNFLQKGILRCLIDPYKAEKLDWLAATCRMGPEPDFLVTRMSPFRFNYGNRHRTEFEQTIEFAQEYDLSELEKMRVGPWRFTFSLADTDITCGVYCEGDVRALVERKHSLIEAKNVNVGCDVEIVGNDIAKIHEYALRLRAHGPDPDPTMIWE